MVCGNVIFLLFFFLVIIGILAMRTRWYPETAFTVLQTLILTGEIDALGITGATSLAALGEGLCAGAQLRLHRCVSGNPVRECVFAVLNDPEITIYVSISIFDPFPTPTKRAEIVKGMALTYALLAS